MSKAYIFYSGPAKGFIKFADALEDKYYGYTMEQLIKEAEKNRKFKA